MILKSRYIFILLCACGLLAFPALSRAQLTPEREAELRKELAQVEAEQKQVEADLAKTQQQSASLARDIKILDTKIKAAQLNIRAKTLLIESLGKDIKGKESHIESLEKRIARGKDTLTQIMRKTNEVGAYSLAEVMLAQESVTGFFEDIDTFESVQEGLYETFSQIRTDQQETTVARDTLDKRRSAEIDARRVIDTERANIQADEKEKQRLLGESKTSEKSYAATLAEKRARAAEIRAALFSLRDAAAIPFGDALAFANSASKITGVRPAFVLAILTQESALGKNVGSCYVTDPATGDGVNVKSGTAVDGVMNPKRDFPPFEVVAKSVGRDPFKTLVSCPQSVGWGGAMGPAQFIASTWVMFKDRIGAAVGTPTPDPWNPAHAFMASSIYLGDLGAGAQTYTAERNAACRYYSGRACSASTLIASYGNSVVSKADNIQKNMIDPLQGL